MEMVDASLEDTHQELRTLVNEYAADFYLYVSSVDIKHPMHNFRNIFKEQLDESMEAVLQYVKERR